jgi:hypothetical protein
MTKLKLSSIPDERPVKITIELPAAVHCDLVACVDYLNSQHVFVSQAGGEPCRT